MSVTQINSIKTLNNVAIKKCQTKPFLAPQKPDSFEKTEKSFNLDKALDNLKSIESNDPRSRNQPMFNEEQMAQIKEELQKTPEKYEPFETIANSSWMKGDIACKLLTKDKDSLKELAEITKIGDKKDFFWTQRFEPKKLEYFANNLSAKELSRCKYIAEALYDTDSIVKLSKNKNLKAPEKLPTVIKEMREFVSAGEFYYPNIEFYPNSDDNGKTFICSTKPNSKCKVSQLYDSNLNRLSVEEAQKYSKGGNDYITKKCIDYRNNTTTKTTEKKFNETTQNELVSEIRIVKNKKGKKIRTEYSCQSDINGILNVKHVMPDGTEKILSSASIDPQTGVKTIKQNLTSLDGTKTEVSFVEDTKGNRNSNYKITDKNGSVLLDDNQKFEVINENKFISTKNGNKFEMTFTDKDVNIKNLKDGNVSKIDFEKFITGDKDVAINLMKRMSGDELIALKKCTKELHTEKDKFNGSFAGKTKTIKIGDNLGTLLHELGHAKDYVDEDVNDPKFGKNLKISIKNKNVIKTYKEEEKLFLKNFPQTQRNHIDYFLGVDCGLMEVVAETNSLLNYHTDENINNSRAQYLQQYFPRTIALIAQELNK